MGEKKKQIRVFIILLLSFFCMITPSMAYIHSFEGSVTKGIVSVDENGNRAYAVIIDLDGNFAKTQSASDEGGAFVEQTATGSPTAPWSTLFMASGAFNNVGNSATTDLIAVGMTQVETHQTAESDDSCASAGQTTYVNITNGKANMETTARQLYEEMDTDAGIQGTGEISTEQSGFACGSFGCSTLGVNQASTISVEHGEAHTQTTAPDIFPPPDGEFNKISIWLQNDLIDYGKFETNQIANRTVDGNKFNEFVGSDTSAHQVAVGELGASVGGEIYPGFGRIIFSDKTSVGGYINDLQKNVFIHCDEKSATFSIDTKIDILPDPP